MRKFRILVADDEPFIARSLSYILEKNGYEVYVASDGQEAVEIAQEVNPDVVFLDVMMPGKDGYQVCREMRSNGNLKARIILLTAKGQPSDIKEAFDSGADAYMPKPFSPAQIVETVRKMVGRESS